MKQPEDNIPDELLHFHSQSHTGLCIKTLEKKVLYQNESCKKRCGDQIGKICIEGCLRDIKNLHTAPAVQGFSLVSPTGSYQDNQEAIVALVVNDGSHLITLQCPVQETISQVVEELKKEDLTAAEMAVVKLRLQRLSNKEVAKLLFISHATVKSHLNNIHRKVRPPTWQRFLDFSLH